MARKERWNALCGGAVGKHGEQTHQPERLSFYLQLQLSMMWHLYLSLLQQQASFFSGSCSHSSFVVY